VHSSTHFVARLTTAAGRAEAYTEAARAARRRENFIVVSERRKGRGCASFKALIVGMVAREGKDRGDAGGSSRNCI
jgi:hypothetical protein